MSSTLSKPKWLAVVAFLATFPTFVFGQTDLAVQGAEFPLGGPRPGDQVFPGAAIRSAGGYVVWQDNGIDGKGKGLGIAALRLDSNLDPSGVPFRVNLTLLGDQEKPQVAMLGNGGAVFVWQGGLPGFQNIYARFVRPAGTFLTAQDLLVGPVPTLTALPYTTNLATIRNNAVTQRTVRIARNVKGTREFSVGPAVAGLANSNAVVVYSSRRKYTTNDMTLVVNTKWTGSLILSNTVLTPLITAVDFMQDVYVQMFTPAGAKVGGEIRVNQFTAFNQSHASVAALANGNFVVTWVSEQQHGENRIGIFARLFDSAGTPLTDEFSVSTDGRICASPAVSGLADGGFTVVWSQRDGLRENGLDIYGRFFNVSGGGTSDAFRINSHTFGDQYSPSIVSLPSAQLVTWNSLGTQRGIFGRELKNGALNGAPFRVNTTDSVRLMSPASASDGAGRAVVIWSSYQPGTSFDLSGQRYVNP